MASSGRQRRLAFRDRFFTNLIHNGVTGSRRLAEAFHFIQRRKVDSLLV
jgi:hypothetical protein